MKAYCWCCCYYYYYYYYYYKMYWLEWRGHRKLLQHLTMKKRKRKSVSTVSLECQMTMKTELSSALLFWGLLVQIYVPKVDSMFKFHTVHGIMRECRHTSHYFSILTTETTDNAITCTETGYTAVWLCQWLNSEPCLELQQHRRISF